MTTANVTYLYEPLLGGDGVSAIGPTTWLLCAVPTTVRLLGKAGITKQTNTQLCKRRCFSLLCPYTIS